jgi:hypothetical protein
MPRRWLETVVDLARSFHAKRLTIPNPNHALIGFKRSETLVERLFQGVYPIERLPKGKDS